LTNSPLLDNVVLVSTVVDYGGVLKLHTE